MGVFDKFLDIMKLNDDYDDDFYDEDEMYDDDYEEEKPHRSFFGKKHTNKEPEFEDFDAGEDIENKFTPAASSKVTPMRQPASRRGASMEVCVVKPTSVDDSREITETLLAGPTNVDITGDLQDLLSGSMETSAVRGRF